MASVVNGYLISAEIAAKLRDLLGTQLHASRFGNSRMERDEVLVKCLSDEPVGETGFEADLYDAEIIDANTYYTDGGDQPLRRRRCWLSVIDTGETLVTPVTDHVYFGRVCGEHAVDVEESHPDERPRVLATRREPVGLDFTDCDTTGVISLVDQTIGDGHKIFQKTVISGYKTGVDPDDVAVDEPTYIGGYVVYCTAPLYDFFEIRDDVDSGAAVQGSMSYSNGNSEAIDSHGSGTLSSSDQKSIVVNTFYEDSPDYVPASLRVIAYDMTGDTDTSAEFGEDAGKALIAACRIEGTGGEDQATRYEIKTDSAVFGGTTHTNTLGMSSKGGIIYKQISVEGPALIVDALAGTTYNTDAENRINELHDKVNSLILALRSGGWWTAP